MKKRYLGDGVYVVIEDGMMKLTSENGGPVPLQVIYLENEVFEALAKFHADAVNYFAELRKSRLASPE